MNMKNRKLRIGYFPLSSDLSATGDRRRVIHWAGVRGHEILINQINNVDCVIFSEGCSYFLPKELGTCPTILDLVDAYSVTDGPVRDFVRRNAKFLAGKIKTPGYSFRSLVLDFARRVDLVIVSSPEQGMLLKEVSKNVTDILDFHEEIPFRNYSISSNGNRGLFWEGSSSTLPALRSLDLSTDFLARYDLSLEVVTDMHYQLLFGKYLKIPTRTYLATGYRPKTTLAQFYPWSIENLIKATQDCFASLVPVNTKNEFSLFKPENRVLIAWRLGLPCLAMKTPSHERLSEASGADILFSDSLNLQEKILCLLTEKDYWFEQVKLGRKYLSAYHTEEILMHKWDSAIESVI